MAVGPSGARATAAATGCCVTIEFDQTEKKRLHKEITMRFLAQSDRTIRTKKKRDPCPNVEG
jgi:hypothetical protein